MTAPLAIALVLLAPKPVDYRSKDLGFVATFPDAPVVGHAEQKLGGEVTIPVDSVGVDRGPKESFLVTVTTYPPEFAASLNAAETLKAAQKAAIVGAQGTLSKENEAPLRGHTAREFWAKVDGGELHARLVMAKERLFMVLALTPASDDALGDKFVQSFSVTSNENQTRP